MAQIDNRQCELLEIRIYDTEQAMGEAAAHDAAECIKEIIDKKGEVNIIFAAARSQDIFLDVLTALPGIDWGAVNAFHMDEYTGLNVADAKSLSRYLESRWFHAMKLKNKFFINGRAEDSAKECERYAALLHQYPADIAFIGIGDNGHLAFNDPHVARFQDKEDVKVVAIDDVSKQQQVNAGNFESLQDVPSLAYTVTIPALLRARRVISVVPTSDKAGAVGRAVNGELSESCPASILRKHSNAVLYLDSDSAKELRRE